MKSIHHIEKGIANYIDNEIMAKFPNGTWQKVAISSIVALAVHKYAKVLADNRALKTMGIVEGDMADIEAYAEQLKRTMPGGGVTIDVPMLGAITLTAPDIDVIVNYINNAERGY